MSDGYFRVPEPKRWRNLFLNVLVLCILLTSQTVTAAPLSADACQKLRFVRDSLAKQGVVNDIAVQPSEAQQTFSADRLERVRNYVVAMEQVLFRCISTPRPLEDGMELARNMPAAKPFYERRTLPLPVRKPAGGAGLRLNSQ